MNPTTRGLAVGLIALSTLTAAPAASHAAISATGHGSSQASCARATRPGQITCEGLMVADRPAASAADGASGYGPDQLRSAYGLTAAARSDGSGSRVYIVSAYNDADIESDLAAYRDEYGLSDCTMANDCLQVLNQNGATSPLPPSSPPEDQWSTVTALLADMVSALCPHCDITVLEATDDQGNGLYDATKEAGTLGAKFVAVPYGSRYDPTDNQLDSDFATTGVVYVAAGGDAGYADGPYWPNVLPNVVSVGGTTLTQVGSTWSQTAWSGGTSGCLTSESKPSWQSGVPSSDCTGRASNDVSAVADPNTGVAVYDTPGGGGWILVGGTTNALGIIVATFALAGTPAPSETPNALLYARHASLTDVTSGSNGTCTPAPLMCNATTGWDGPTGIGTPNGIAAFSPPATTLSAPKTATIKYGKRITLHATLTNSASHRTISGATVRLLAKQVGSSSYRTLKTLVTSARGVASASLHPTSNASYKWSYAGSTANTASTSRPQAVTVDATVTLAAKPAKAKLGKKLRLYGTAAPAKAGEKITVEKRVGKSWKKLGTAKLAKRKLPNGKTEVGYVLKTKAAKKGKATYRAVVAKTGKNGAGTSKAAVVKIT
jgi:hypothetical protein